jgi:hypothetical protein
MCRECGLVRGRASTRADHARHVWLPSMHRNSGGSRGSGQRCVHGRAISCVSRRASRARTAALLCYGITGEAPGQCLARTAACRRSCVGFSPALGSLGSTRARRPAIQEVGATLDTGRLPGGANPTRAGEPCHGVASPPEVWRLASCAAHDTVVRHEPTRSPNVA